MAWPGFFLAILDRCIHHVTLFYVNGPSYREHHSRKLDLNQLCVAALPEGSNKKVAGRRAGQESGKGAKLAGDGARADSKTQHTNKTGVTAFTTGHFHRRGQGQPLAIFFTALSV